MSERTGSPETLVAIAIAARKAGNRRLERLAKRQLEDEYQVKVSFPREPSPKQTEGDR